MRYFGKAIVILSVVLLLAGCKDKKKLYHGLGDSLRKTVKYSLASNHSLPELASDCDCTATAIIALKQYVTETSMKKQMFDVSLNVINGFITLLPIGKVKTKILLKSVTSAIEAKGLAFTSRFEKKIDWDSLPEFKINKLVNVSWLGVWDPQTNKVTIIIYAIDATNKKKCVVEYTYKVNKDKLMVDNAAEYKELK